MSDASDDAHEAQLPECSWRHTETRMDSGIGLEFPQPDIALVRVHRPEARNALNMAMRARLGKIFAHFEEDEGVRVIIITGSGGMFAAGADLGEFVDADAIEQMQKRVERYWKAISSARQPIIAAVNGFALGGGMELAMCADIIIAGQTAKFGQPEVKVGIIPGAGGTQRLVRAVGKFTAMHLCLTGAVIDGAEAHRIGLVAKLVEDALVETEALRLAQHIASLPPLAVQQAKEVILSGADAPLETAMLMERRAMQLLFASRDKREGMTAFLEKRRPNFSGR